VDRGTCPLLFEVEGTPCVLSHLLFRGRHFCTDAQLHNTGNIYIHRSFRLLVIIPNYLLLDPVSVLQQRECNVNELKFVVCKTIAVNSNNLEFN